MAMEVGGRARSQAGFTLVEILVVMLILALLAAIAIPAFFSQRDKARDAEAKVQVRTAQTTIEAFATERNGSYAGANVSALQTIEPSLRELTNTNFTVQVAGSSGKYKLAVLSPSGNEFTIRREVDNSVNYPCTTAGAGGCPPSGFWG